MTARPKLTPPIIIRVSNPLESSETRSMHGRNFKRTDYTFWSVKQVEEMKNWTQMGES